LAAARANIYSIYAYACLRNVRRTAVTEATQEESTMRREQEVALMMDRKYFRRGEGGGSI
jgi:hypothetical protein